MTCAVSCATARRRDLRVGREHRGQRGGVRRARGPDRRGDLPEGKIATGKLAQALMHGARVIALREDFDAALQLVREVLVERHPIALVNSANPFRRGAEDRGVRGPRRDRRDRRALHPGRQRGQHHRVLEGLSGGRRGAADTPAGRPRARRRWSRAPVETRNGGKRDPHRQPGSVGGGDGGDDGILGRHPRGVRRRDPRPYRGWPPTRRCSASRPPPRARGEAAAEGGAEGAGRIVYVLAPGHGLKDPPKVALRGTRAPSMPYEPRDQRRGQAVLGS